MVLEDYYAQVDDHLTAYQKITHNVIQFRPARNSRRAAAIARRAHNARVLASGNYGSRATAVAA